MPFTISCNGIATAGRKFELLLVAAREVAGHGHDGYGIIRSGLIIHGWRRTVMPHPAAGQSLSLAGIVAPTATPIQAAMLAAAMWGDGVDIRVAGQAGDSTHWKALLDVALLRASPERRRDPGHVHLHVDQGPARAGSYTRPTADRLGRVARDCTFNHRRSRLGCGDGADGPTGLPSAIGRVIASDSSRAIQCRCAHLHIDPRVRSRVVLDRWSRNSARNARLAMIDAGRLRRGEKVRPLPKVITCQRCWRRAASAPIRAWWNHWPCCGARTIGYQCVTRYLGT